MSENVFHLELKEDATRRWIFGSMIEKLDESIKYEVGRVVGDSSIRAEAHCHNLAEVEKAINISVARDEAKKHAKGIYAILAEAEAAVHGCSVEETHFHEVGKGMTVREILGISTALVLLNPSKVTATAIQTGQGQVECAHGILDIPTPATKAIIDKYEIPCVAQLKDGELCTPTSAAIIAYMVDEFV